MNARDHIRFNEVMAKGEDHRYYLLANNIYDPHKPMGAIYIIQLGNTDHYKIGISIDPNKRLKQIQAKCPIPLNLVYTNWGHDYAFVEKAIHYRYREQRIRGEWFCLSTADVVSITSFFAELSSCWLSESPDLFNN